MSYFFAPLLLALFLQVGINSGVPIAAIQEEWIEVKKADPNELVQVTLALKQTNTEWLEEKLLAVSDPDSPRYGFHVSLEEVIHLVHAYPEGVTAVKEMLGLVGIVPKFTLGEGFAVAYIPVSVAENLFSAKFYQYQHRSNPNLLTTRTLSYKIPNSVKPYLDFICCIDKFPQPNQVAMHYAYNRSQLSVTPKTIDGDYKISGYKSTNENNSQAIAAFLKQYFKPSDLKTFQKKFDIADEPIIKVIGKNNEDIPGGEASLDVEYITGVGQNVATWFISVSTFSNHGQEDFLSWLMILLNTTDSPYVHSVSYGDYEDTIDISYMMRCEDEFKKLGIMGKTLLFASGDSGVNCHGAKSMFRPNWPTSSPSVTAVGGTESMTKVWVEGGGGFSNVFPTPEYQKTVVENYLKNGNPPNKKYFNESGRAYPDVSAFATDFLILYDGAYMSVDGTSCAAPTVAGIISLLNDVRLNKGKSTLGFLNPLLYKNLGENGFFDITEGDNSANGLFCPGFKAVKGWDPASGWGSPNFQSLKDLVLQ